MALRNYSTVAVATTTTAALNSSVTTIPVTALSGYPTAPFTGRLEAGTPNEEIVTVTGVSGLNLTVIRGADGSTAKSHLINVTFDHAFSARDFAEPNAHVNATAGVHGITGNVVGDSDVQTLSGKTLTSPTLNGSTLDAASTIGGVSGTALAADRTAWTVWTPTYSNSVSSTTTGGNGYYKLIGKTLYLRLDTQINITGTAPSGIYITGPTPYLGQTNVSYAGSGFIKNSGNGQPQENLGVQFSGAGFSIYRYPLSTTFAGTTNVSLFAAVEVQ